MTRIFRDPLEEARYRLGKAFCPVYIEHKKWGDLTDEERSIIRRKNPFAFWFTPDTEISVIYKK